MYGIFTRYQYWKSTGIEWTEWFVPFYFPKSENPEDLEERMKEAKNMSKSVDKATKLKHEFKIDEIK